MSHVRQVFLGVVERPVTLTGAAAHFLVRLLQRSELLIETIRYLPCVVLLVLVVLSLFHCVLLLGLEL